MANSLSLPASPRTLVFRALVKLLRTNPDLKRVVKTWRVWDGDDVDDADPTSEPEMPAITMLPYAEGASPLTPVTMNSPLGVRIQVDVDSYNLDDLLDLWAAVEAAVFTGDGTQSTLNALRAAYQGVNAVKLFAPAITPNPPDLPNGVMVSVGTLSIEMTIKQ